MDLLILTRKSALIIALIVLISTKVSHSQETHRRERRSARVDLSWTRNNKNGIVFVISNQFNAWQIQTIRQSINEIARHSCLTVRTYTENQVNNYNSPIFRNFVYIRLSNRCESRIGMQGGRQDLQLAHFCFSKPMVLHELMHSLGYRHEQARPDRDKFVYIDYSNVRAGDRRDNFDIDYKSTPVGTYDFASILHYPKSARAINPRRPVIISRVPGQYAPAGRNSYLSSGDMLKIRYITGCKL